VCVENDTYVLKRICMYWKWSDWVLRGSNWCK